MPVVAWMVGIFALSASRRPLGPACETAWADLTGRLAQVIEYAGLALWLAHALSHNRPEWRAMTLAIIVTAGYAVIDGAHQDVVPGRESCLAGLACDTIGGAAGLMAARIHSGGACDAE